MEQGSRSVEQYQYRTVEREQMGAWNIRRQRAAGDLMGETREKRSGIRASRCGIVRKRWWNRAGEMVE